MSAPACPACKNLGTVDGCDECGRVSAQPRTAPAPAHKRVVRQCVCGIAAEDCEYHKPPPNQPYWLYGALP